MHHIVNTAIYGAPLTHNFLKWIMFNHSGLWKTKLTFLKYNMILFNIYLQMMLSVLPIPYFNEICLATLYTLQPSARRCARYGTRRGPSGRRCGACRARLFKSIWILGAGFWSATAPGLNHSQRRFRNIKASVGGGHGARSEPPICREQGRTRPFRIPAATYCAKNG